MELLQSPTNGPGLPPSGTITSQLSALPSNSSGMSPSKTSGSQLNENMQDSFNEDINSGIAKGYIHNISPFKTNGNYFDFQLQTKNKTYRAVCFSPKKRNLIKSFHDQHSPVKLKRCRLETKSNSEDLMQSQR